CAPRGFTVADFATTVRSMSDSTLLHYHARRAAYDLKKLRAKNLLTKLGNSHRYSIPSEAICIIGALVILREKVLRLILADVGEPGQAKSVVATGCSTPSVLNARQRILSHFTASTKPITGRLKRPVEADAESLQELL